MKHYLKLRETIGKDVEISNWEFLNLINEREEIKVGTQIVEKWLEKEVTWEVIEINDNKIYWAITKVNKIEEE